MCIRDRDIIDKPLILSKGLPGNLVAANLEGIMTNVFIFFSNLDYKQRQKCTFKYKQFLIYNVIRSK